jgi:uncharacterized protein involved in exopolysaccharide biosynthesis
LKSDVAQREAKLREMSGNLGANNPQYQRAQAELASMRSRLAAETAAVVNGVATNNRVNAQREAELTAAVQAQKTRLLKLKEDRDSAAVLQRDVDGAQRAFDAISTRQTQSNLESQTNQTNIAVLNPAEAPTSASKPRKLLNVMISVFLGSLLGIGLALMLELAKRHVRSEQDLLEVLDLPVLSSISSAAGMFKQAAQAAAPKTDAPGVGT